MIKNYIATILLILIIFISQCIAEAFENENFNDVNFSEDFGNKLQGAQAYDNHLLQRFEPGFPKYNLLSIDGSMREDTAKFIKLYQNPRYLKILTDSLDNAVEYRLYIRRELEKAGLPAELEYLPVVESYYKTNAKSSSGALGMWQFMANSVKPFLILTEYVDERLDPWKETDAAIKKLKENYVRFTDWNLAIGAYNCGAGAMAKAVEAGGQNDYWLLVDKTLIPEQTRLYNPKLIAIADLVINHEYYEINIPDLTKEYADYLKKENPDFEYITVDNAYRLSDFAKKMRIDISILKELNPSFVKGYTPPNVKSKIRIPYGTLRSAEEALRQIDPINIPFKYKVQSGDTLWGISRKYGVTVKEICDLNNIKEDSVLSIGKILYIPSKLPR